MKKAIWLSVLVFSTLFAYVGDLITHSSNPFSLWSILLGGVGALFGVWVVVKFFND